MTLFRAVLLVVVCASALSWNAAAQQATHDAPADDGMDRTIRPGDDFYRYANGGWLKAAAKTAGRGSYDNRAILTEKTSKRVRDLIQDAAANPVPKGSNTQKVGDYFASFMDVDGIEAKGLAPIADEMAAIAALADKTALAAYLGGTQNTEVDGLTTSADHIFGLFVNQSFDDAKRNYPHLSQGGLGMLERDNYLDPSPKMAELRAQYQKHIAAILKIAGVADPDASAAHILALETAMAQAWAPDADAADVFKQNNPWKRADFPVKAPGIDWNTYFAGAGISDQADFIVWQPTAVTGTSALVASESLDTWKQYLQFHLVEHYSGVLPKTIGAEDFNFYGAILSGAKQPPEREKAAIAATNAALGQAVGQMYTKLYFPPEAKAKAQEMGRDLLTAYRARIANWTWMSLATREKAQIKLAAFTLGLGYPDTWIDYSTLDVVRGDAHGNMRRAEAFNRAANIAQLKEPADPAEWRIDAQTVGAVILFTPNTELFAAGILQPPYFDPQGDAASNYGSAGAGMAHEITHSFDELGNIYDDQGRIGMWWTPQDLANYRAATAKLAAQFDDYCPFIAVCVNGQQVSNENSADLAGLLVAHDAYILSLKGKPDATINGLTGEQRFFLAFAQRWRKVQSTDALLHQIKTDTHAPGEYRSDTVRNLEDWYRAYGVGPPDKLYLEPDARARIW